MLVANLQQKRHICQLKTYTFGVVFNAEKFGDWLEKAYQESSYKSYAALGEKIGVSRTTISSLAKARPQSVNGKPSRPGRDLVIGLARALSKDESEALLLAGHAPLQTASSDDILGRLEKLPEHLRQIAKQQIRGIIEAFEQTVPEETKYVPITLQIEEDEDSETVGGIELKTYSKEPMPISIERKIRKIG